MHKADYIQIIKHAWKEFDDRHEIRGVYDVSMYVSSFSASSASLTEHLVNIVNLPSRLVYTYHGYHNAHT